MILPHNECIMMPRLAAAGNSSGAGGEIQLHLQAMLHVLRPQDTLKMAVRLESLLGHHTRYMAIVSASGRQDNTESVILGIDYVSPEQTTVGLVLPIWASTLVNLDGDGGISIESAGSHHVFRPVSVQAMWSAFQSLHKEHAVASNYPYFPGGLTHTWVGTYESAIASSEAFRSEWHYTYSDDTDLRADSLRRHCFDKPPEKAAAEKLIRVKLKDIMQSVDLDEVTSKDIREKLEEGLQFSLSEYKEFVDQEILVILGQMDKPSQIFPFLYLGTEWNASNWDELRQNSVGHIVNVTKEVDNFFPGLFYYVKIRVSDEESAELLRHWDTTFRFIQQAKENNSAVLVHCKKGISRSSSTVIAYAMKEYGWSVDQALDYVKEIRNIITPNKGFMEQLRTYQGILDASKNRKSQLWNQNTGGLSMIASTDSLGNSRDDGEESDKLELESMNVVPVENDESVIFTEKIMEEPSPSAPVYPNVLMASENILKPYPSAMFPFTEMNELSSDSFLEVEGLSRLSASIKVDEDSLPQLSRRPPVQKTLQSVEARIKNHSKKQPDELSLKDMQVLLMKKGGDKSSSSGISCSESSSLASTSGDEETEFSRQISACGRLKQKRRNSKSSSCESTGDSAVAELCESSPSRENGSLGNRDCQNENPILLAQKTSTGGFETGYVVVEDRLRGESDPGKIDHATLLPTQNRARKIMDKLLNRSTPTEPTGLSTNGQKLSLFKPSTNWYNQVGLRSKIASSCRSRPKSVVLSGEWGGSPRLAGREKLKTSKPSLKVAQPGKVRNERDKLERLSLGNNQPSITTSRSQPKVAPAVRRITSDFETQTASRKTSDENVVKSLVGVFENSASAANLTEKSENLSFSERRRNLGSAELLPGASRAQPEYYCSEYPSGETLDDTELEFRRTNSLRLISGLDGERIDSVRPARSMISLATLSEPLQEH